MFAPDSTEVIEVREVVRDLGIIVDDSMGYLINIKKAMVKANNMAEWALRTFRSREKTFLRNSGNLLFSAM